MGDTCTVSCLGAKSKLSCSTVLCALTETTDERIMIFSLSPTPCQLLLQDVMPNDVPTRMGMGKLECQAC
jgi:hypothetical protein